MIRLALPSADDAAQIVESLLDHADRIEFTNPQLAWRKRRLANQIGDGLPTPVLHPGEDQ